MAEPRIAVALISTQHDVSFDVAIQWMEIFRTQPGWEFLPIRTTYVLIGRNQATLDFLATDCTNLLMFDCDQVPPREGLDGTSLLDMVKAVADLDVVTGMYVMRAFPYPPLVMRETDDVPVLHSYEENQPILRERGLMEVDIVGTGAMLIRREVLQAVADLRGFPDAPCWLTTTRITGDDARAERKRIWAVGEDTQFCRDARSLGYKVWVDSRWESGHFEERLVSTRDYQLAARATYAQAEQQRTMLAIQEAERRHAQGKKLWVPGMARN